MAVEHLASCRCGQLRALCTGDPVRVSVCHCLDCQRRSGSAFAVQARFPADQVRLTGNMRDWSASGVSGGRTTFHFCPDCGGTVAFRSDALPELVAIPVGTFADTAFAPPTVSGYEERRHPWAAVLGDAVRHFD